MTLYDCGSLCKIFRINQSKYKTREEEIEQTKKTNSVWLSVVGRQGLVFHSIGGKHKHTATPLILPFSPKIPNANTWRCKYVGIQIQIFGKHAATHLLYSPFPGPIQTDVRKRILSKYDSIPQNWTLPTLRRSHNGDLNAVFGGIYASISAHQIWSNGVIPPLEKCWNSNTVLTWACTFYKSWHF